MKPESIFSLACKLLSAAHHINMPSQHHGASIYSTLKQDNETPKAQIN